MKNNDFENIYCKSIGLPRDTSYETYDPKQTFFDGDLDALAKEIKSEEAMLSYAETFANITEYNAAQKIKMCKKLKVVTRGHTKYHESMENFLDSQIYSLEEEKEAAPSGNGNSLKDIWASKSAWYIKIWESIKHIWSKIVEFVKQLIGKFVKWWKGKSQNGNDIKQLEDLSNDPDALKRIGDWFGSTDWEFKSDHGIIPVNGEVIKNLKASLDDFTRNTGIPMKFKNAVNETVRAQAINSEVVERVNEITAELANFLHVHLPPKFSTNKKEDIQHIKIYMNKFKEDIEYNRDPAKFVKQFAGVDLLPKGTDPKIVFGNDVKFSLHDTSEQVAKKIGPFIKGFINKQKTLDEVNVHLEKDIMGPYNTVSDDLKESHDMFIKWMKGQKVVKNDQGEINENYKTDNESTDVTAFACVEAITGLYNCITRTLNIYNEIVKQVINYCKQFETIKQKLINFGNKMDDIGEKIVQNATGIYKNVFAEIKKIKDEREQIYLTSFMKIWLYTSQNDNILSKHINDQNTSKTYEQRVKEAFTEIYAYAYNDLLQNKYVKEKEKKLKVAKKYRNFIINTCTKEQVKMHKKLAPKEEKNQNNNKEEKNQNNNYVETKSISEKKNSDAYINKKFNTLKSKYDSGNLDYAKVMNQIKDDKDLTPENSAKLRKLLTDYITDKKQNKQSQDSWYWY